MAPSRRPLAAAPTAGGAAAPVLRLASEQAGTPYLDAVRAYAAREPGRLHVPGHAGGLATDRGLRLAVGADALALDIPELIDGVDVGAGPAPLARTLTLAAEAWGARRTWFVTGGASQANHAALLALRARGGPVVMQRNVHASAINAVVMFGLTPAFVAPEVDPGLGIAHGVGPDVLDAALAATPGAAGVLVVSPTYFGAVADVAGLAEVAHAHGVPLVVDEAWGAHLAFSEALPEHALAAGADLVVSSPHKTLGSLGQSAMLHLGRRSLVEEATAERAVDQLGSTSPSSLLLASLDAARRRAVLEGRVLLDDTLAALADVRAAVRAVPGLDVLDERAVGRPGVHGLDPLRLVVDVRGSGATGYALARRLREDADVEVEIEGEAYLVASFGMGGPVRESGARLADGLWRAVLGLGEAPGASARADRGELPAWGPLTMPPAQAAFGAQEPVPVGLAAGRICAELLTPYPPGVPIALPGERLTDDVLRYLVRAVEQGATIRGASDPGLHTVRVVGRGRPEPSRPVTRSGG